MSPPARALATLREPTPEEASRWYKPRKNPVASRLKLLIEFLAEDETIRVVKKAETGAELLVDTGAGTTLRLLFRPSEIDVHIGPFLIEAGKEPIARATYVDEVSSLIE